MLRRYFCAFFIIALVGCAKASVRIGDNAGDGGGDSGSAADAGIDASADAGAVRRCGGFSGDTCAATEYCELVAECGGDDTGGVCMPRPAACGAVLIPVCGCDNTTYGNACEANRAGVSVMYVGACGACVPSVRVTPTSGLITDETGSTASFTLSLNCPPAADVSISLASSDESEGTVSFASATFTSSNWATPVVVTVTGVADSIVDGPQGYTIVTAPAISADEVYNGMDAVDVSVTNNDIDTYICGGEAGLACPDSTYYCAYSSTSVCGGGDFDGVCMRRPTDCPDLFDPVCGCDNNTYPSRCDANAMGFDVRSEGACGSDCTDEAAALAELLGGAGQACSVTVRLDYTTYAILGYQVFCDAYSPVAESAARVVAEADTTFGEGSLLLSSSPSEYYLFYESPGDVGGAAVVNSDVGMTVFGGSIVWLGTGDINYPATWRNGAELGASCAPGGLSDRMHEGWNLMNGEALTATQVDAALNVVDRTGVPGGFASGPGYIFSTLVLLYPRSVGEFNPATAEWIVIVNGGWLE